MHSDNRHIKTRIRMFGPSAVLVDVEGGSENEVLEYVHRLYYSLTSLYHAAVLDIVPAYTSLAVFFQPERVSAESIVGDIRDVLQRPVSSMPLPPGRHWDILVQYDTEQTEDMKAVIATSGLSRDDVVSLHSGVVYQVAFIGFLPGFPYLLGLPERLAMPRKRVPDKRIAAGSVAIGGAQTGVYPWDSPGGWYVLGTTDFSFFSVTAEPCCPLSPGDTVRFIPV